MQFLVRGGRWQRLRKIDPVTVEIYTIFVAASVPSEPEWIQCVDIQQARGLRHDVVESVGEQTNLATGPAKSLNTMRPGDHEQCRNGIIGSQSRRVDREFLTIGTAVSGEHERSDTRTGCPRRSPETNARLSIISAEVVRYGHRFILV
jgi:hypothetical protein